MLLSFSSGALNVSSNNPSIPSIRLGATPQLTSISNSTLNVNNSVYWDGHLFSEVSPWLYNQSIATFNMWNDIWSTTFNSTYDTWAYNQTIPAIDISQNFTVNGYVPYIGAIQDVDLNSKNLTAIDYIEYWQGKWKGGNITYVPCGADIQPYIDFANQGDIFVLGSCSYPINKTLKFNKYGIAIIGQGREITQLGTFAILPSPVINISTGGILFASFSFQGFTTEGIHIEPISNGVTFVNMYFRDFGLGVFNTGDNSNAYGIKCINSDLNMNNVVVNTFQAVNGYNSTGIYYETNDAHSTGVTPAEENANVAINSYALNFGGGGGILPDSTAKGVEIVDAQTGTDFPGASFVTSQIVGFGGNSTGISLVGNQPHIQLAYSFVQGDIVEENTTGNVLPIVATLFGTYKGKQYFSTLNFGYFAQGLIESGNAMLSPLYCFNETDAQNGVGCFFYDNENKTIVTPNFVSTNLTVAGIEAGQYGLLNVNGTVNVTGEVYINNQPVSIWLYNQTQAVYTTNLDMHNYSIYNVSSFQIGNDTAPTNYLFGINTNYQNLTSVVNIYNTGNTTIGIDMRNATFQRTISGQGSNANKYFLCLSGTETACNGNYWRGDGSVSSTGNGAFTTFVSTAFYTSISASGNTRLEARTGTNITFENATGTSGTYASFSSINNSWWTGGNFGLFTKQPRANLEVNGTVLFDNGLNMSGTNISNVSYINPMGSPITFGGNVSILGSLSISGNISVKRPYFTGYDNSTQPLASATAAQVINITNNADYDAWMINVTGKQNLTFQQTGDYVCFLSPEFFEPAGQSGVITFWIQKNGVDIPWSNSRYTLASNSYNAPSITYQFDITNPATDNIRFMWWSDNANTILYSSGVLTSPTRPSIPAVLIQCSKISEVTP